MNFEAPKDKYVATTIEWDDKLKKYLPITIEWDDKREAYKITSAKYPEYPAYDVDAEKALKFLQVELDIIAEARDHLKNFPPDWYLRHPCIVDDNDFCIVRDDGQDSN